MPKRKATRPVTMTDAERLQVVPISLERANAFVYDHHRHHRPVVGHLFSLGLERGGWWNPQLHGVATVGRPVARALDDGTVAEVNRLCTDGTRNACSMLYAACWREAHRRGYRRLITYILASEPGTSLRAAGWRLAGVTKGRSWGCRSRPRNTPADLIVDKQRWERAA